MATVAVLGAVLAGCGGGSDDAKPVAATSSAATQETPAPSPTPPPVLDLVDDEESADAGEEIVVAVLENDTLTQEGAIAEGLESALGTDGFTVTVDTAPSHGTATVDGTDIVYTSTPGYAGEDEFTYRVEVKGDASLSGTAVVRITVAKPTPTPKPTEVPAAPKVSYANCDAARAAGAAPVHEGDPGYARHLDRDGDGVGCEPYSGGSGGSGGNGGSSGGTSGGSTYYANCSAVRAAGAAPIHAGDPGYGRHLDRDGDGVACE
ncbi:excalibur calcium-binding domain-containing protein [Streptomyces sp. ISL-10]|uniref:excalibur calcium-binding domain-containing protein n=1 Tax=Streptomyces sp. ISL-10 TaxID=2819172 RepID=UPI0027E4185B|nr:excalibur calcium-binding domain-containing protein [Streptomyces sp. ISL-10]